MVELIKSDGGEAISNGASVTEINAVKNMVQQTMDEWGRIDILVNNAGILRDKSFHKVTLEDFELVMDVHFQGTLNCTHSVFPIMRSKNMEELYLPVHQVEYLEISVKQIMVLQKWQ